MLFRLDISKRSSPPGIWTVLFLGLLSLSNISSGQALSTDNLGSLTFQTLGVQDGLPGNVVTAIQQDRAGFIWIATLDGLARYDGRGIQTYRHDPLDSSSLISDKVAALLVDSSGTLWVGSEGVQRYDPSLNSFVTIEFEYRVDPFHSDVIEIFEDSRGFIWVGLWRNGAVRIDPRTNTFTYFNPSEPTNFAITDISVRSIVEDASGRIWFGTQAGLDVFDYDTGSVWHMPSSADQLENSIVQSLQLDARGNVWAGTSSGLFALDISKQDGISTQSMGVPTYIQSLFKDQEGRFWAGSESRLDVLGTRSSALEVEKIHSFEPPLIPTGFVTALFQDRSGIIWIGTDRDGVAWSDPNSLRFTQSDVPFPTSGTRDTGYVTSILEDGRGWTWIGSENGLAVRKAENEAFEMLTPRTHGLPGSDILSIYQDHLDTIWVGTLRNGFARFDEESNSFTSYSSPWSGQNDVYSMHRLDDGRLLVGTFGGLLSFDPVSERFLSSWSPVEDDPGSMRDPWIIAIHEDKEGRVWLGHDSGLELFDPDTGRFAHFAHDPKDGSGISSGTVMALASDLAGRLLISVLTSGLDRYDPESDTFEHFTRANSGLSSNYVHGMIGKENGMVWIGSGQGVNRLDTRTRETRFCLIDQAGQNSAISVGAYHQGPSGRIYFGRLGGFFSFNPADLHDDSTPPLIAVSGIHVDNRGDDASFSNRHYYNVQSGSEIELSFEERSFSLDYAVLHYRNSEANSIEYRLSGYDDTWIRGPSASDITFTSLDPGEYVLELRGMNSDFVSSNADFLVHVHVLPPWWKTLGFRIMAVVALMGMVFSGHHYRLRHMRLINNRLRRLVKKSTSQVEAQRAALEVQAVKLMELDEMKSRFFSNISHELRTPLTLIRGRIEDIRSERHGRVTRATLKQLDTSLAQTHRLQQLIEQLLDLSRFQEQETVLKASEGDISRFVRRVAHLFDSLAVVEEVTLKVDTPPDIRLYFDPDKLEKILTNLVGNAIKFTPTGGSVHVSLESPVTEKGESDLGRFVKIIVRDSGRGISEDAIPLIFDRFYQEDQSSTRSYEGMGVGLALVKELVELHGGDILVDSESGVGSCFTVLLPTGSDHLTEEERVDKRGIVASNGSPEPDSMTVEEDVTQSTPTSNGLEKPVILVVEDNPELRDYLADHLRISYSVVGAADGVEGLEKAEEIRPDLIVSDVMMPRMDGLQLLESVKMNDDLAAIPVILLTARTSTDDKIRGLKALADDYVSKPFRINELKARIHNLIANRASVKTLLENTLTATLPDLEELTSAQEIFLAEAHHVVLEHLTDEGFGRSLLASELNVSERTLGRRLSEAASVSPLEFIRSIRMQQAEALLQANTYDTVAEVSYAVGFKTASYFTRMYRQTYGKLPGNVISERS